MQAKRCDRAMVMIMRMTAGRFAKADESIKARTGRTGGKKETKGAVRIGAMMQRGVAMRERETGGKNGGRSDGMTGGRMDEASRGTIGKETVEGTGTIAVVQAIETTAVGAAIIATIATIAMVATSEAVGATTTKVMTGTGAGTPRIQDHRPRPFSRLRMR
jgi:hypothetical protein